MKHSISFLLLLLVVNLDAQLSNAHPMPLASPGMDSYLKQHQTAVLKIQVIHAPDTIPKVPVSCTYVGFGSNFQTKRFYQFNQNGLVKIVLEHPMPYQQIWLNIDHYLYAALYVNSGLTITIDASKIKSVDGFYFIDDGIEFSGMDGEFTAVMNKNILYKKEVKNNLTSKFVELAQTRNKYDEKVFLEKFDSTYEAIKAINEEFIVHYPKYKWAIENNLIAEYYGWLFAGYWGSKMPDSLFKELNSFSPYLTSNEGVMLYSYLHTYLISKKDNPEFNVDDQLFNNYSYYNTEQKAFLDSLKYYLQFPENEKNEALKKTLKKKADLFLTEMTRIKVHHYQHLIDSFFSSPKADILKTFLLADGKLAFSKTYPEIIKGMHTNWCRNIAVKEFKEAAQKQKEIDILLASRTNVKDNNLYIGKPLGYLAFDANLYRLDSVKSLDEFIVNLKSKFANKALVIDFWATWCVPCIRELPVSKQLHETNKDLPIEFVYICTSYGSNMTVWKNKVAELQVPGTHIFADDKFVNELKNKFNSEGSGFPTYIVIDANGKLKPKAIEWIKVLDRDKLRTAVGL